MDVDERRNHNQHHTSTPLKSGSLKPYAKHVPPLQNNYSSCLSEKDPSRRILEIIKGYFLDYFCVILMSGDQKFATPCSKDNHICAAIGLNRSVLAQALP